ncbi:hypothetical protein AB0A70_27245 [Streptomyces morookaense]|uniref:hypothetical protein n=1 Tax=Streptomyces morookaense TaxID=1970 RepID=UPI0033F5B76B
MNAGRGGKAPGRRKAVPRDMQDQQAGAASQRGPAGLETPREPKSAGNAGERSGGTGDSREPQTDEPPD